MSFDFLTIVVIVNALATFVLWSERRPEKIKKKFRKQLFDTKPITPKHQLPKTIGGKLESLVSEGHRVFFADFADFANVVNWWLADEDFGSRWRLQELPETELRLPMVFSGYEPGGPTFGRSYAVFYNQVRLGALEVQPSVLFYSADDPRVSTYIHLDYVRLLSFKTIRDFFAAIAEHACYDGRDGKEYFEAQQAIHRAMTEALWRSNEVDWYNNMNMLDRIERINTPDPDYGEIDLQLDGVARWYLVRREALRKQAPQPPAEAVEQPSRLRRAWRWMRATGCLAGAGLLLVLATGAAGAQQQQQQQQPQRECFTVEMSHSTQGNPQGSILLDRCTGKTWLLLCIRNDTAGCAFRWAPIPDATEPAGGP